MLPVDETARSDLGSEPGDLVMDLSADDVSFPTLCLISLLTVDYPQNSDKSYLGVAPQIRGCYVGLPKLAVHAPRSPSNSPPPVRVRKPLKFASISDDEEEPADLSSGDDSVGDPTVTADQLSDSGDEELPAPRKPVPLKVLGYLGQHSCFYAVCLPFCF